MLTWFYLAAGPWMNMALRPVGLCLWATFEIDEDEDGLPTGPATVSAISIGRFPSNGVVR
ncbi:MAG: hypothetical protein M9895_00065 [Aquamicrobium sp.]|uniref:hypothetical protein n=1 Tax=Aquamicrobium sp. TaxID=1872579 RepID=UPI00349E6B5B|nr:hypothetical protein [Aquamicrobium sp.]